MALEVFVDLIHRNDWLLITLMVLMVIEVNVSLNDRI